MSDIDDLIEKEQSGELEEQERIYKRNLSDHRFRRNLPLGTACVIMGVFVWTAIYISPNVLIPLTLDAVIIVINLVIAFRENEMVRELKREK